MDLSLTLQEKVIFGLRSLYRSYGYTQYKMSKFEEYDLYANNKDFLISDRVITFTDTNGKLMALKPDVTLSIIKNIKDRNSGVQKLFYNENVYRISKGNQSYKEIMQVGLECIGDIGAEELRQVIILAAKSLQSISENCLLNITNLDLMSQVISEATQAGVNAADILKCVEEKNEAGLKKLDIPENILTVLCTLLHANGAAGQVLPGLIRSLDGIWDTTALQALLQLISGIADAEILSMLQVDFSVVSDINYYNGIIFKGFIEGVPSAVLSGGQYDKLMQKMKHCSSAVGFAVYLDMLDMAAEAPEEDKNVLNIALPKGRLGEKVYAMFEKAGFPCPSVMENSRKLIFENPEAGVRYFWVKPSDVAIYVERGAADIGVAGKDILLEYKPEVYELLDLDIGKCRMAVAAKKGFCDDTDRPLRVATKFSNTAQQHYLSKGRDIDIIHLNGSIEIAPILGLSDVIVDIVETGTTLKENNLEVIETIVPISARLIANKTSYQFKSKKVMQLMEQLAIQTEEP
ncbi:MAG: ATP phosphoribosyltransferase [Oscillospiraceae bacterium]|nr:ATP phosphoribosyltransferase [Oscillospiraceae bacterium]